MICSFKRTGERALVGPASGLVCESWGIEKGDGRTYVVFKLALKEKQEAKASKKARERNSIKVRSKMQRTNRDGVWLENEDA